MRDDPHLKARARYALLATVRKCIDLMKSTCGSDCGYRMTCLAAWMT